MELSEVCRESIDTLIGRFHNDMESDYYLSEHIDRYVFAVLSLAEIAFQQEAFVEPAGIHNENISNEDQDEYLNQALYRAHNFVLESFIGKEAAEELQCSAITTLVRVAEISRRFRELVCTVKEWRTSFDATMEFLRDEKSGAFDALYQEIVKAGIDLGKV